MRHEIDVYYLLLADQVATRSTCDRLNVGAVIVNNDAIISTGYNGAPHKMPHCIDVGHMVENDHCKAVVHAEVNAILHAARNGTQTKGGTIYCNYQPCWDCFKTIINAGIRRVVYSNIYKKEDPRVVQAASSLAIEMVLKEINDKQC